MEPKPWPSLYIVGAPRSGTTFLSAVVGSHSDVFVCDMKEPHFFGGPTHGFSYSGPDDTWVNRTWINDEATYISLFADRQEQVLCDASTNTMYWPEAVTQIERRTPASVYVCVLRDPVERIESMFFRHKAQGLEPCPSIIDATRSEQSGERADWSPGFRYLEQSRYSEHVSRLTAAVGDRFIALTFDEVKDGPLLAAEQIWSRCGLEFEQIEIPRSQNATPYFSNPILRAILVRPLAIRTLAARVAPEPVVARLVALRERRTNHTASFTEEERSDILDQVIDDARRTEDLIGKRILRTAA